MNQLHVGFGRVNITPAMGTPIGGYYVVRLAEKVLDELEANAVAFAMGDKKALLISADISGLFYQFAEPLCQQISKATGVPADCIFITCTHTHTGPEVNLNRKILPEKQEAYFPFFCSRLVDAALFAHSLAMRGKAYSQGTGILKEDTAATIRDVGHIGRVGMQPTDEEIVRLMIEDSEEE